jgi:hypothetical protein
MANPRHEHEWRVWESVALPNDKVLIPGCITHASVIVEHPELVAERILRLAKVVGRERVIAGSDCGFASTLAPGRRPEVEPEIVWAKFKRPKARGSPPPRCGLEGRASLRTQHVGRNKRKRIAPLTGRGGAIKRSRPTFEDTAFQMR